MGDIRIANCIEMFFKPEDTWQTGIDRFLKHAEVEKVGGEMAWFKLGKPLHTLEAAGELESILKYIRDQSGEKGVGWEAIHWLGAAIPGFYLTHPNEKVRNFTAECIAEQCKALYQIRGEKKGGVGVVGSPFQRNLAGLKENYGITITWRQAEEYFADTIAKAVRFSEGTGVIIAPERLVYTSNKAALLKPIDGKGETDLMHTMAGAVRVVKMAREKLQQYGNLAERVAVMVDFKAAYGSGETPVQAYGKIPEGLATYHAHVQAGASKLMPGFNARGLFEVDDTPDISGDINFLAERANEGKRVVLSTEAFPPADTILAKNSISIPRGFSMSNGYLKKLIAASPYKGRG